MASDADASRRPPRRLARRAAVARVVSVIAGVSGAGLAGGTARAEPAKAASLSWVRLPGAEACIGARALGDAVERRLGKAALVSVSRAEVSIEGRIAAHAESPKWRVELVVADANGADLGTRQLSSDAADCRALDAEIALTVALLVDPDAVQAAGAAAAGGAGGSGATGMLPGTGTLPGTGAPGATGTLSGTGAAGGTGTSSGPGAPGATGTLSGPGAPGATGMLPGTGTLPGGVSPPGSAEGRTGAGAVGAASWGLALVAGPSVSLGLLPSVSPGAQVRAIVTPPRFWPFQLAGSVWAPSAAGSGDATSSFFLASGSVSACPLNLLPGGFRTLACAGIEVGELRAGGFGLQKERAYSEAVVQAAIEGRVLRRLWGPFAATVGLTLQIPFVRARFYYVDAGGTQREVFLASALAASADLSIGVDL